MSKITFLVPFVFLFLFGCSTPLEQYNEWQNKYKSQGYTYFALSCPASDYQANGPYCGAGASVVSRSEANAGAIRKCSESYPNCVVVKENDNWVYSGERYQIQTKENEMEKFIKQCEQIGFKRNTEKLGECVLRISETEKKMVQNQVSSSGGNNSVGNLILLQESLKLLQPPANPRRNVQCTYNTVGGILGVNCF
jgi:hypothetical protein